MAALFNVPGAFALELSQELPSEIAEQLAGREMISVLGGTTEEEVKSLKPEFYVYKESANPRSVMLEALTLKPEAQGLFKKLFRLESTLYVLSWAYHIATDPVVMNPHAGTPPVTLRLRAKQTRRFLGEGLLVFPPRPVRGGIGVIVQLWESHAGMRDFGTTLAEIDKALGTSHLYDLLGVAAATATAQPELIVAAPKAAEALMGTVSAILRSRGDSSLDVFAGFYGADVPWNRKDLYTGSGVEIRLGLT